MSLRLFLYLGILLPGAVMAESGGFSDVAANLMEPVSVLTDFVTSASLIIGLSFLFAAFVKYMQYRVNPLAVPISNVIWLLLSAIALLCLPIAYKLLYEMPPYLNVIINKT